MEERLQMERTTKVSVFRSPGQPWAAVHDEGAEGDQGQGVCALKVTQTDRDDHTELRIEGVLDAVTALDMRVIVDAVVGTGGRLVQLDLARLRLIDSSGVGTLVSLYKRVRDKGGSVTVIGIKDQPLAVFRLLRLDHIFSV